MIQMRYFCAFSYLVNGQAFFGNVVYDSPVDPYENIEEFLDGVEKYINEPSCIILNYKRVM